LIFQGKAFSVRRHRLVEPGGAAVVREIIHHPGSAVILAVNAEGHVLMVRQYRLAPRAFLWELPAGTLDAGETPLHGARRELQEETGYLARRWSRLVKFYPSPGILDEQMTLFLARQIRPGVAHPESDERIVARFFPLAELLRRVRTGTIRDAKTLVGLLYWQQWMSA
jgi:ADP-ribose pyrophosphatase